MTEQVHNGARIRKNVRPQKKAMSKLSEAGIQNSHQIISLTILISKNNCLHYNY